MPEAPNRRVLLIDDVEAVRKSTRMLLEHHGLEVHELSSGLGAEDAVARHRIALVLTDLAMPDRDGAQTVRSLRRRYPDLPIIVLTGTALAGMAEQCGANCALTKPVRAKTLFGALDALLDRAPG